MTTDKKKKTESKTIARNKRAYHDYHVLETITAGIVLTGSELKSIRQGKVVMNQAFARINEENQAVLLGCHIPIYHEASYNNHHPDRTRVLLLNKREIQKLKEKTQQQGTTLVALAMFFSRCWVKVELGVCKGKKLHDKRASIAERDNKRDMARVQKAFNR